MSGNAMVSMEVSKELVREALDRRIQAAIVSQLGNADELIGKAVSMALAVKVNKDGLKTPSSYDNQFDFLEIMAGKSIREAATSALKEWLDQNAEKVKAAVLKELKKPSRQRSIATAYADAIEKSLKCRFSMNCDITFDKKRGVEY